VKRTTPGNLSAGYRLSLISVAGNCVNWARAQQFSVGTPWELRAQVSTWGGTDVLKALGQWHEAYDDVVKPLVGSGGTITLPIQAADRMRTATAAVVMAVRAGIDPEDKTTVQEVADALFNQPDRPRGKL
jgi:hypothetical protein